MIAGDTTHHRETSDVRIGIVGAGRFGTAAIRTFGLQVTAVVSTRPEELAVLFPTLEAVLVRSPEELSPDTFDVLWIAVPDSAIGDVVESLAGITAAWEGKIVMHASGATPLATLAPLRERGAATGVLHPNAILSGVEPLPSGLAWGVSLDGVTMEWARDFLSPVEPVLIPVDDADRALYHSAAAFAANYSMTLFRSACRLYENVGVAPELAAEIVARFMREGVRTSLERGVEDGLTGPVVRGDFSTVEGHLIAIREAVPDLLPLIKELVRATVKIVGSDRRQEWEDVLNSVGEMRDDPER